MAPVPDAILRSAFRVFSPTPLGFSPQTAKHRATIFPDVSLCFGRRSRPPDRCSGQRVRSATFDHLQQSGRANVYVGNVEVGKTPCAIDYTYYGTREIRLVKPATRHRPSTNQSPCRGTRSPRLDLVSETMAPREIRDERTVSYTMSPQMIVPTDHLFNRAEELAAARTAPR